MSVKPLLLLCALTAFSAVPAAAASIPFASSSGIDDWHPDGDEALFIRSRNQWSRAELFSSCFGLRTTDTIGFDTEADGSLTQHSAIVVEGKRCPLTSLEKMDAPPANMHPRAAKKK